MLTEDTHPPLRRVLKLHENQWHRLAEEDSEHSSNTCENKTCDDISYSVCNAWQGYTTTFTGVTYLYNDTSNITDSVFTYKICPDCPLSKGGGFHALRYLSVYVPKTCAGTKSPTPKVTCDGGIGSLGSGGGGNCKSPFGKASWIAKCTPASGYVDIKNGKCMTMTITFPGEMASGRGSMVTHGGKGHKCGYNCIQGPACNACCNYSSITCKDTQRSGTYCEIDAPPAFTNLSYVFDHLPPSSSCPLSMTTKENSDGCNSFNRTYTLTGGKSAVLMNCTETFALKNFEAPMFNTSLSAITVDCNASANPADYFDPQPGALVNSCRDPVNVTFFDTVNPSCGSEAYQPGVYTRTWTAKDPKCGGTANISQTVTIIDNTPPVASCNSTSVTQSLCETLVPASASACPFGDECTRENLTPTVTCCQASDGSIEHIWEATDACGNKGSIKKYFFFNTTQCSTQ